MDNLIVYTAIIGAPGDILRPISFPRSGPDDSITCICFSDSQTETCEGWRIEAPLMVCDGKRQTARWHKVMSHRLFPDASATLWHDATHTLTCNPRDMSHQVLHATTQMATFKHPRRNCVYEEIEACVLLRKDEIGRLVAQEDHYRTAGYPSHNGLFETSCLVRKSTPSIARMNESWWQEIEAWQLPRSDIITVCPVEDERYFRLVASGKTCS